ncbi:MAG: C_GCAxxG_C_C family protein [Deltaproteobacteria bacterium]|nr:C_GCAxxG_C_C family protein [Deltaproteobacteria bacterium]
MEYTDRNREKIEELGNRVWDDNAIKARINGFLSGGIPKKRLNKKELLANKKEILDRVQLMAEEYNYIFKNCAQGTAMALMEEFGLGDMQVIKALTLFPGIGGSGEMCGGVTGSIIAFGLFYGGDDPFELEKVGPAMEIAQRFMAYFEDEIGYLLCSDIQEKLIFGKNMDPGASAANMGAFASAKGFEKCGLPPGIGARLAAEFMIDRFPEYL